MSIIKKIFFLSLTILFLSLLFWGVYNLSFKKAPTAVKEEKKAEEEKPIIPPVTEIPIAAISDEAVLSPVISLDGGKIRYYAKSSGKAYEMDLNGKDKRVIATKEITGLVDALWSPDQTRAISKLSRPDGNFNFFYYDYGSQTETPIKNNVDEIVWQNTGNKIFYKYYDAETKKRSLNISDPDGANWTKLADIDYRNISITSIPQSGLVSFWNRGDAYTETIFESVPILSGERKIIFQGKFGADYLWSGDGNKVLMSNADVRAGNKMQLGVMNYNGGEYKSLDAPTFISKCVWSKDGKSVYYALPGGIPPNAVLPNEYNEGKFFTTDTFWRLDVLTGEKTRIIEADKIKTSFDATGLFLNMDESALFFVNKGDGKLYKIVL